MPHERPKHTLISDHLLREIRQGDLPVGALIPTEAELMRSFGVSRNTVRTAIQSLKARGIVGICGVDTRDPGVRLEPVEHLDTFWFAVSAFEPDAVIVAG